MSTARTARNYTMRHALLRLAVVLDCAAALFPFHALKGRVDQSSWITQKTPTAPTGGLFGRRVGGARAAGVAPGASARCGQPGGARRQRRR